MDIEFADAAGNAYVKPKNTLISLNRSGMDCSVAVSGPGDQGQIRAARFQAVEKT
jgi:ribosomal protein S9